MKNVVLSVFDVKTRLYSQPFVAPSAESGVREFTLAVRDSAAMKDKFPKDYELYEVGAFYSDSGELLPVVKPVLLVRGIDILEG